MIRKQFVDIVSSTGMATTKELRSLSKNSDATSVTEFELLNFENFNDSLFAQKVAKKFNLNFIDLRQAKIPQEILTKLPKNKILRYRAIPIQKTSQKVILAIYDPTVSGSIEEIQMALKMKVEFVIVTLSCWRNLFESIQESVDELVETIEEINPDKVQEDIINADDIGQDVITFVNKLLAEAYVRKASDVHVEVYEKKFRIRMRIDGTLIEVAAPPKSFQLSVASRIKIMAQMDISQRRLPQDGRIKLKIGGAGIDFRVSSVPTLFGEKLVLRILDKSTLQVDLRNLGFEEQQLKVFQEGIEKPFGMCIVTGPTGSGKTTTLYSALADLNKSTKNISTVEEPVEFNFQGINQIDIKKDIGLTFTSSLRALLRQDPDIMMIGEIRDLEVGEIAIEASLTGHLVLSTLHTNDAASSIQRLTNMGIEPYLIVAALNVVVAQRLCRKICNHCKEEVSVPVEELVRFGYRRDIAEKVKIHKGNGCQACNGIGYKGRVAIHEVLPITPSIKDAILRRASSDEIKLIAIKEGMKTLRMTALTKVAQGLTTLEEALNTSASDKLAA